MRRTSILAAAFLTTFTAVASPAARRTPPPQPNNLTAAFVSAGLTLDRLEVYEIGGIVLVRGRAYSKAEAESAGQVAYALGYKRVANLVQVVPPPDDVAIERTAEQELTMYRPLEGCRFRVASSLGVISVAGTVQSESQKDLALQILRNIDGVRQVRANELVRVD